MEGAQGDALLNGLNALVVDDAALGEGGAAVEDVPSEPGNESSGANGDEGDNEIPGDPSEENEDENTPGSEPGEENGDENTPGSEPGEENGDNETPTPPNLTPTNGGSDEIVTPGEDLGDVSLGDTAISAVYMGTQVQTFCRMLRPSRSRLI